MTYYVTYDGSDVYNLFVVVAKILVLFVIPYFDYGQILDKTRYSRRASQKAATTTTLDINQTSMPQPSIATNQLEALSKDLETLKAEVSLQKVTQDGLRTTYEKVHENISNRLEGLGKDSTAHLTEQNAFFQEQLKINRQLQDENRKMTENIENCIANIEKEVSTRMEAFEENFEARLNEFEIRAQDHLKLETLKNTVAIEKINKAIQNVKQPSSEDIEKAIAVHLKEYKEKFNTFVKQTQDQLKESNSQIEGNTRTIQNVKKISNQDVEKAIAVKMKELEVTFEARIEAYEQAIQESKESNVVHNDLIFTNARATEATSTRMNNLVSRTRAILGAFDQGIQGLNEFDLADNYLMEATASRMDNLVARLGTINEQFGQALQGLDNYKVVHDDLIGRNTSAIQAATARMSDLETRTKTLETANRNTYVRRLTI